KTSLFVFNDTSATFHFIAREFFRKMENHYSNLHRAFMCPTQGYPKSVLQFGNVRLFISAYFAERRKLIDAVRLQARGKRDKSLSLACRDINSFRAAHSNHDLAIRIRTIHRPW